MESKNSYRFTHQKQITWQSMRHALHSIAQRNLRLCGHAKSVRVDARPAAAMPRCRLRSKDTSKALQGLTL